MPTATATVYAYEMNPIDIRPGVSLLHELPAEHQDQARKLSKMFLRLHPEDQYREPPYFGFMFAADCCLEMWAFRTLDNGGTAVVASPVPVDFARMKADTRVNYTPYEDHGPYTYTYTYPVYPAPKQPVPNREAGL
jgi:hypothetical protein